ncbi:RhoGEF group protein [Sporothrix schenckii 1099-18]|uniref:RhoGEF group protein n=1 Tax=Sporothrix schenckii 1099-18 TaxID=1397361 RepID=A0A0F2M2D8_SPOSC|nr:RhoGEF group protein [Sporothrix schenckii 1099-18]KJR83872.1 RhoGEF group protein [Sporothrix schenckii 1099-18]
MPWQPLPHIAFAVATFPFAASHPEDLVLEIGDELYIIEETTDGSWLRGYLLKPPSLLAGLTSVKGQTLEARVFSGIFPRSCVEVRELLGESVAGDEDDEHENDKTAADGSDDGAGGENQTGDPHGSDSAKSGIAGQRPAKKREALKELELSVINGTADGYAKSSRTSNPSSRARSMATISSQERLSVPVKRDPNAPRPQAPVPMLKIGDETPTSAGEPLIDEIASCLREWHSTNLHELLLTRQYHKLDILSQLIASLNLARQQFLHNVLTTWEYSILREKTVWDLVRVNKLCGGEVIVRDPVQRGRILTGDDSVVEITQLQSIMSMLSEPPQPHVEPTALHHLLVDVKGFAGASTEDTTLVLSLVGRVGGILVRLSENFSISTPPGGSINNLTKGLAMRSLFTDLSSADIGEAPALDSDLFLVVAVRSAQQISTAAQPHSSKPASRSGSGSHGHGAGVPMSGSGASKDGNRPPLSSGNKSVRRSLMWSGKSSRAALSRSANTKLDSLNEQGEDRPGTGGAPASRDGQSQPPSTATSKSAGRSSFDGSTGHYMTTDRMTGVGVLKLNAIMKQQNDEVEHVINIWAPSDRVGEKQQAGDDWDPLIQELMHSRSGQFEKSRGSERVQVHLRAFNHQDADVLIRATPTLLAGVGKTNKMGFSGAPTKPRSDIYVTLQDAMLSRQVQLSRYGTSPAALPNGMHGNNLQVTLEVRRANGERIDNCIFPYSNGEGLSTWRSLAAERSEGWRQTLRLSLVPQDVSSAHVVMFVADMPNPPFAVAYMPLWDQSAFVRDGAHSLLLYRVDENTVAPRPPANAPPGRGGYLSLPWASKGRGDAQSEVTGPLAALRVESYLCSTRFSQDRVVLGLLKWREGLKENVPSLLQQLIFVPEIEVVKLLSDVLDALFAILVDYAGNDEYEDLVFTALVRVLDIVHDRRFNVGPLVDHYAENKFNYPFATPCLVRSFTRLLAKPTEPQISRKLRATFKVVRHILKFITHARDQQKVKEAGIGITSSSPGFTRHLQSIFKALEAMMRNTAPVLVGSQTLAVQHFHTWLPELSNLLTTEEILHIAIDFMDACANVKGKLVLYKLVLIINYSRLEIFSHPEQRSALSANTVRWIAPHWGHSDEVTEQWKEQVRLCCSILASQIDHLGPEIPDYVPKILESYLAIQHSIETAAAAAGANTPAKPPRTRLSLLFPTQYPFASRPVALPESGSEDSLDGRPQPTDQQKLLQRQQQQPVFDEALVELSAILSAVSNSPSGMQLELADGDLAVILENTLRVHMSILRGEAFPSTWLSTHIFHHKSIMRTLQYLSTILLESFLPDPDDAESFNTELWKLLFTTLLMLVSSPSLALETFPEQKRRAVWKIAGDVREHGADLLRRTWEAIGWDATADEQQRYGLSKMGGYQVQYVPTLVGPIVELCLSVHEGLRRMAVEVLQTMIVSEWTLSEDLFIIQAEIIDYLDHYFKTKPLTESILQKLFVGELLARFTALADVPDEPLYTALRELIATIDEFLDLLVAVHGGDGGGAVTGSSAAGALAAASGANSGIPASGEASHLINRLRLMEFLRDMQKEEMFVRYVHQLASLQAASRNHAEAGLALRLHAELYEWDPLRTAPALSDPPFPAQSHFERKERIYFDMIKHFEEGEAWSSALAAYKELQVQYETNIYDFSKLARTERAIATVYETIAKSDRLVPKYFRVMFRGLGFPANVRDKEFVYEGSPNERTSAFTDRLQEQYPAAQIVVMPSAPGAGGSRAGSGLIAGAGSTATEDMIEDIVEGQFLVVSAISPHRDLRHHVFQRARVPQVIREYLVSSHPQVFSTSLTRQTTGPVAEHYVHKTTYTTAEVFPTILRRSEIVTVGETRLSAKETALERILRKTAEMTTVEKKVAEGDSSPETAQVLLDAISISVNPSSESSVVSYRELLPTSGRRGKQSGSDVAEKGEDDDNDDDDELDEDDEDETPEMDPQENAIKMALVDHAMMIKRSLALLARSSNDSLSSHADDLMQYFEATFAPEIAIFTPQAVIETTTTSPTWPRSSPTESAPPRLPDVASTLEGTANGPRPSGGHAVESGGAVVEEASAVQPIAALRQGRGTRLSFLGGGATTGRKRDSIHMSNSESTIHETSRKSSVGAAEMDSVSEHSRSRSKENANPNANANANANAANNRRSFFRPNGSDKTPPMPQYTPSMETTIVGGAQYGHSSTNGNGTPRPTKSGSSGSNNYYTTSTSNNRAPAEANKPKSGAGEWVAELSRKSSDLTSMDRKRSMSSSAGNGQGVSNGVGGEVDDPGPAKMGGVRKRLSMLKLGKKSSKANGFMGAVDEE